MPGAAARHDERVRGQSSSKPQSKQSSDPITEARDTASAHHDALLKEVLALVRRLTTAELEKLRKDLK